MSLLSRGRLYARTLAHLHPMQLAFRPLHMLRTTVLRSSPLVARVVAGDAEAKPGPPLLAFSGSLPGELIGLEPELARAREALLGSGVFVGRAIPLTPPTTDFRLEHEPKLIRYQLAYLGHARALAVAARSTSFERRDEAASLAVSLVREFVDRVPPGQGDAWDPYPVALRLLNLLIARELLRPVVSPGDAVFLDDVLPGVLGQHARWLAATLELHLLGNHLFADGAALFTAGCALTSPQSSTWRTLGQAIIARSLAVDVLSDGGHSERSPMYAAIYVDQLELVLAAARALGIPPPAGAMQAARTMAEQLQATAHPDGESPLFGDAAFGEAPLPADVAAPMLGGPASLRSLLYGVFNDSGANSCPAFRSFPEAGVAAIRLHDSMLLVDAGPLGTFDQPGHAHSDALTYELSHRGRRLVSDGGAGHYEVSAARAYFRGPWAHSSISVDGRGPDELWSAFRAGRRGQVEDLAHVEIAGLHVLRGAVKSAWGWRHERLLFFLPEHALCVFDRVTGADDGARVASHIHFAPDVSVNLQGAAGSVGQEGKLLRLVRLLGDSWATHRGETEPLRGYTAFRLGQFEPSSEVCIDAKALPNAWGAAYVLLLGSDLAVSPAETGASLTWRSRAIRVGLDGRGLRWEEASATDKA